jgi:hypothetical protein
MCGPLVFEKKPLEDRRRDSLTVHFVRPALDAHSELLHFGHRTILGRERWGRALEAPPTVASRTRHPNSLCVSGFLDRHMSLIVLGRTKVDGVVAGSHAAEARGADRMSRANTTMRCAAEYSGWHADRINRS